MSKTSKELEEKLAELQAASVEAGVEFKRIDEQIEQAKLEAGMMVFAGSSPDKTKLNELKEKRENLDLYIYALDEMFKINQRALIKARNG